MYIITGGAGFIGSAFARKLNSLGINKIIIVDELGSDNKWKNLRKISYSDFVHKDDFINLLDTGKFGKKLSAIIHMGACSSTTESNADFMIKNNFQYTKDLALIALRDKTRFIYASSAATYGAGENGYSDDDSKLEQLSPLNIYGYSKHLFDSYAHNNALLKKIVGLKFFNVFGPNEYHKDDMKSVALKAFYQIQTTGKVKLFRSHRDNIGDGQQMRDFVYIKDCCNVMWWFLENPSKNGLYNLGTGKARSWNDLVTSVFNAIKQKVEIEYIDMPESIRNQYQYFTEANMSKLFEAGYTSIFHTLENAVSDYVKNYLLKTDQYL
jgi:ADP-L-glycero-D-manno-heptose 6-epimerase